MKTKQQINDEIIEKTLQINVDYPELSEFINEMPVTIPDEQDPAVQLKHLKDYNDSLDGLLTKYAINHQPQKK